MALRRISQPEVEPVSLELAKRHMNVSHTDDDSLIELYISGARSQIEDSCHAAIVYGQWEFTLDVFPSSEIDIPMRPLVSISSVDYYDGDGVLQSIDPADYYVDTSGYYGWIIPAESWPSTLNAANAVRIRFYAGYPPTEDSPTDYQANIPPVLKCAVLELTANKYNNRESYVVGQSVETIPLSIQDMLWAYRAPVLR